MTGNHQDTGLMLWSLPDGARVRELPFDLGGARFGPDGKWLVASTQGTCRIWQVGVWREIGQFEGFFQGFSPDSRLRIQRVPTCLHCPPNSSIARSLLRAIRKSVLDFLVRAAA